MSFVCLPGPGETWGLAVNEALACGCRVIVSNRVGCAEDFTRRSSDCFCFEWDSPQQLIKVMHHLILDGKALSSEVRKKLIQHFRFEVFCSALKTAMP